MHPLFLKKLAIYSHLLSCIVTLSAANNSIASNGQSVKKNYHITKPEGGNVDVKVQLTEASGLALSHNRKSLWTVSDDRKDLVFKMTLQGKSKDTESFKIVNYPYQRRPDLEGVCLSGDGQYVYLVQEREMAIIKVQVTPASTKASMVASKPLSLMENYSTKVQPYLGKNPNAGLEGITFHTGTSHIYVLLEAVKKDNKSGPLLIEINEELTAIVESKLISGDAGFIGFDGDTRIDGSGIDYDRTDTSKNHFYITSDKGQRVFHYDWDQNKATPERDLEYKNSEGVAYDPTTKMLYIVTDGGNKNDSKLYTYLKQ
jgi:uncharacterized protein YjiK